MTGGPGPGRRVLPGEAAYGRPVRAYGPELAAPAPEQAPEPAPGAAPAPGSGPGREPPRGGGGRAVIALALGAAGAGAGALLSRGTGLRTAVVVALAAAAPGAAAWLLGRRFVVITVRGPSMEPAYRDGDRVLVRRGARPRAGDVVVAEHPGVHRHGGREYLIKRVAAVAGDLIPRSGVPALARAPGSRVPEGRLVLLGDNRPVSLDSRELGYFPAGRVLGRVLRPLAAARTEVRMRRDEE